jgi:hypothetical protein
MLLTTVVAVSLSAASPATTPSPSPSPWSARPVLSKAEAESLRLKLLALEERVRQHKRGVASVPGTVVVTEGELNSYLNLVLQPQLPAGLRNVDFQLDSRRITARAMVDLDQINARLGNANVWSPLTFLSGMVSVELAGRLKAAKGFGSFELDEIRVGPMAVPPPLLARMIASSTRTRESPQGFDVLSPFRLPYGLRNVRVQRGRLALDF